MMREKKRKEKKKEGKKGGGGVRLMAEVGAKSESLNGQSRPHTTAKNLTFLKSKSPTRSQ